MANGYVQPPPFQNFNPLFRAPFAQRFPGLYQGNPPPPPPPSSTQQLDPNDPSGLFTQPQQNAQCAFPSAFPATGPNIIQRFWIRLFKILIYNPYIYLHEHLSTILQFAQEQLFFLSSSFSSFFSSSGTESLTASSSLWENRWSIIIGLVIVVIMCVGAWFFSPKGENNTIWRATLVLSFASCYIMWAITFLAQWHPLIEPRMTKLRKDYAAGS